MNRLPTYFRRMRRMLLRRGRTREDAEDLIQEAFVRMQEYCERGGRVHQPEGFLVRTVLRLAINAAATSTVTCTRMQTSRSSAWSSIRTPRRMRFWPPISVWRE